MIGLLKKQQVLSHRKSQLHVKGSGWRGHSHVNSYELAYLVTVLDIIQLFCIACKSEVSFRKSSPIVVIITTVITHSLIILIMIFLSLVILITISSFPSSSQDALAGSVTPLADGGDVSQWKIEVNRSTPPLLFMTPPSSSLPPSLPHDPNHYQYCDANITFYHLVPISCRLWGKKTWLWYPHVRLECL